MTRKLPFPSERFDEWPEDVRVAWQAGAACTGWSKDFVNAVRRAYAAFRGFARTRSPNETLQERIEAFAEVMLNSLAPSSAVNYLEHLAYALPVVEVSAPIVWLTLFCRDFRNRHIARTPRSPCRAGRVHTLSLPPSEWPYPFQRVWFEAVQPAERRRYRDRRQGSSAPSRRWSESYIKRVARGYGMYLCFALREGMGAAPTADGIDRFWAETKTRVSSVSIASYVWEIYEATRLLFPGRDWSWLRDDAEFLKEEAKPSRNKASRIARISELRNLALKLLKAADRRPLRVETALDHRDALILLMLTYKPARRRNIATICWGNEVKVRETGGSLFFAETKNGAPDGHPVDASLARHLLRHWERYRPLLAGADTTKRLWISKHGGPLTPGALSRIIGDLTKQHLKRRISPHLFRDAVATSIAEHGQNMRGASQILLGQRDPRSAHVYDQHARSVQAARALENLLDRHRRVLRTR